MQVKWFDANKITISSLAKALPDIPHEVVVNHIISHQSMSFKSKTKGSLERPHKEKVRMREQPLRFDQCRMSAQQRKACGENQVRTCE